MSDNSSQHSLTSPSRPHTYTSPARQHSNASIGSQDENFLFETKSVVLNFMRLLPNDLDINSLTPELEDVELQHRIENDTSTGSSNRDYPLVYAKGAGSSKFIKKSVKSPRQSPRQSPRRSPRKVYSSAHLDEIRENSVQFISEEEERKRRSFSLDTDESGPVQPHLPPDVRELESGTIENDRRQKPALSNIGKFDVAKLAYQLSGIAGLHEQTDRTESFVDGGDRQELGVSEFKKDVEVSGRSKVKETGDKIGSHLNEKYGGGGGKKSRVKGEKGVREREENNVSVSGSKVKAAQEKIGSHLSEIYGHGGKVLGVREEIGLREQDDMVSMSGTKVKKAQDKIGSHLSDIYGHGGKVWGVKGETELRERDDGVSGTKVKEAQDRIGSRLSELYGGTDRSKLKDRIESSLRKTVGVDSDVNFVAQSGRRKPVVSDKIKLAGDKIESRISSIYSRGTDVHDTDDMVRSADQEDHRINIAKSAPEEENEGLGSGYDRYVSDGSEDNEDSEDSEIYTDADSVQNYQNNKYPFNKERLERERLESGGFAFDSQSEGGRLGSITDFETGGFSSVSSTGDRERSSRNFGGESYVPSQINEVSQFVSGVSDGNITTERKSWYRQPFGGMAGGMITVYDKKPDKPTPERMLHDTPDSGDTDNAQIGTDNAQMDTDNAQTDTDNSQTDTENPQTDTIDAQTNSMSQIDSAIQNHSPVQNHAQITNHATSQITTNDAQTPDDESRDSFRRQSSDISSYYADDEIDIYSNTSSKRNSRVDGGDIKRHFLLQVMKDAADTLSRGIDDQDGLTTGLDGDHDDMVDDGSVSIDTIPSRSTSSTTSDSSSNLPSVPLHRSFDVTDGGVPARRSHLFLDITDENQRPRGVSSEMEELSDNYRTDLVTEIRRADSISDRRSSTIPEAMTPESEVAMILARMGSEIESKYSIPMHTAIASVLSSDGSPTYELFENSADSLIADATGLSGLSRIALVLMFTRQSSLGLLRRGHRSIRDMTEYAAQFIADRTAGYILDQGGWSAISRYEGSGSSRVNSIDSASSHDASPRKSIAFLDMGSSQETTIHVTDLPNHADLDTPGNPVSPDNLNPDQTDNITSDNPDKQISGNLFDYPQSTENSSSGYGSSGVVSGGKNMTENVTSGQDISGSNIPSIKTDSSQENGQSGGIASTKTNSSSEACDSGYIPSKNVPFGSYSSGKKSNNPSGDSASGKYPDNDKNLEKDGENLFNGIKKNYDGKISNGKINENGKIAQNLHVSTHSDSDDDNKFAGIPGAVGSPVRPQRMDWAIDRDRKHSGTNRPLDGVGGNNTESGIVGETDVPGHLSISSASDIPSNSDQYGTNGVADAKGNNKIHPKVVGVLNGEQNQKNGVPNQKHNVKNQPSDNNNIQNDVKSSSDAQKHKELTYSGSNEYSSDNPNDNSSKSGSYPINRNLPTNLAPSNQISPTSDEYSSLSSHEYSLPSISYHDDGGMTWLDHVIIDHKLKVGVGLVAVCFALMTMGVIALRRSLNR